MTIRSMFAVSLLALGATAADASAQTNRGLHLGIGANGSSFQVDADDNDDRESGAGIALSAGYNFTPRFGLVLNFTGASIGLGGGDYAIGHTDLLGRLSLPNASAALVPYLELGVSDISLQDDADGEDEEDSGKGVTGAVGLNYFFTPKLALDVSLRYTAGGLETLTIGGAEVAEDVGVNTGRVAVGVSWFPRRGR